MKTSRIAFSTAVLVSLAGVVLAQWTPPPPALTSDTDANGIEGVSVTAYIKGDPQAVWNVIADTPNIGRLFDNVKGVKLVKEDSDPSAHGVLESWEYQYNLSSPIGTKIVNLEVTENSKDLTANWKRVSGDLKAFEGSWAVSAAPQFQGYTKVVYKSYIDGGFFAPQVITNKLNKDDALAMVPKLQQAVTAAAGK